MKHNIVLKGYGAYLPTTPSKLLCLGTAESYGIEQIHITPGADWENLLIKATFRPPSGDAVVVLLGEDGVIDVPPEATAVAAGEYNPGLIVFSGVSDGVQRISANLAYTVIGHAPVEGKDSTPTPSQWEQLVARYQSKVDKQQGAENAGKVLGIGEDGLVKPVEQTGGGGVGNNGVTFIPAVSEDGVISWTNDGDLPNPEPVNIKGPKGDDYVLTEADKQEIAQKSAALVDVPEALPNPHALNFTGAVSGTYDGSAPMTVEIPEGSSGGAGQFRHIRTVVIPEDASTDTSGVNWLEREQGGYWFGFDTDENGEPFSLTEIFCVSVNATCSNPSWGGFDVAIDSPVPSYGYWGAGQFYLPAPVGKQGEVKTGFAYSVLFSNGNSVGWNAAFAGGVSKLESISKEISAGDSYTKIESMRTLINNGNAYGFLAGSTFKFYGR